MQGRGGDQDVSPVCAEPKIFVGQVPPSATEAEITQAFSVYGPIDQTSLPKKPDGKSRGFAMLRFSKWAHAEAAIEAENGKHSLGGDRPLVVKLADPPKMTKDGAPATGITPKKLFIGQISTATESEIRELFKPYGNVLQVNIHTSAKGASCAFVRFEKWFEAEDAIEAINGQITLGTSPAPLVVKFADGKPKRLDATAVGVKRGNDEGSWPGNKRVNMGGGGNLMSAGMNGSMNSGLNGGMNMGHMNGPYGMGMGSYGIISNMNSQLGLHENSGMNNSMGMHNMNSMAQSNMMPNGMNSNGMAANSMMNHSLNNMNGMPMLNSDLNNSNTLAMSNMNINSLNSSTARAGGAMMGSGQLTGASDPMLHNQQQQPTMGGIVSNSMANGLSNQSHNMGSMPLMGMHSQYNQGVGTGSAAGNLMGSAMKSEAGLMSPGMNGNTAMMGMSNMMGNNSAMMGTNSSMMGNNGGMMGMSNMGGGGHSNTAAVMGMGMHSMQQSQHPGMSMNRSPNSPQQPVMQQPQRVMGAASGGAINSGMLGSGGHGASNNACPWKLFVGQVPFEATEQHLAPLFAQYGDITNIMVLRKPGTTQSRGCAFVTYANQHQAYAAIEGVSGKMCVPGDLRNKPLIVNFATKKAAA